MVVLTTYTYVPELDAGYSGSIVQRRRRIDASPEQSSVGSSGVRPVTTMLGSMIVIVGIPSTEMPSALEAASAVRRVEESEAFTAAAVVEAGTAMVAVMITLAAAMVMVTGSLYPPAAAPIFCSKFDLALSE